VAVAFFIVVVVTAGASGVALLVWPGSTDRYFSWALRPHGAASLIGGFYVASAVVFGWALALPWRQVRPLVVAVLGLAVPTLVLSLVHDEVFDFGRWQAVAWVVLFGVAPLFAVAILLTARREPGRGSILRGYPRVGLALLAIVLAALGVMVWLDATRDEVARHSPVDLVGLTGAYLGAWCSFLAILCGWAAARGRWDDARMALFSLAVATAGATVAFARSMGELRHPLAALVVSSALSVLTVATYATSRPDARTRLRSTRNDDA
jgi:hypothetical protein